MGKITLSLWAVWMAGCLCTACSEGVVVNSAGERVSVLGRTVKAGQVTFVYHPLAHERYESMSVVGDFTGWNPHDPNYAMAKNFDGSWSVTVELSLPGRYVYKYTADGQWMFPDMSRLLHRILPVPTGFVPDGFGGTNAYIDVE